LIDTFFFLGLAALWLGAWYDWRNRSVPNKLWLLALAVALPLALWEAAHNPPALAWRLAGAALAAAIAFPLWLAGNFGAADAKAVMVAGFLMSPFGYWSIDHARFIPILDALLPCLLLAEVWRRLGRHQATPFLVVLAPVATLTPLLGGILWWPFVWISHLA